MDLRLVLRVLARFKFVAALGLILSVGLAFISFVKVGPNGLTYRAQQTWSSTARVFITSGDRTPVASGSRGASVALVWASLTSSDALQQLAYRKHGIVGLVTATPAFDKNTQATLPILNISGIASSPTRATVLANDGAAVLNDYVTKQQAEAGTPPERRYSLKVLNAASPVRAVVAAPRSKTRPIMVLVLGLAATLALVLILENLKPRLREVRADAERAA